MKKHHMTLIATVLIAAAIHPAAALGQTEANTEAPSTLRMRVENMQNRHKSAVTELTTAFQRMATDPSLISSKETVDAIDLGDRALQNTKATCGSLIKTLQAKAKSIESEPSFSDNQKTELLAAVNAMIANTEEVSAQCAATLEHLGGAYKAMGKWRTIYRTYLDLNGEDKAREQVKVSVAEFIAGLTAKPDSGDSGKAEKSE